MTRPATLAEIRAAVEAVVAYQAQAGCSVGDAVDVCDYQRIVDDSDRRVIRNAVLRRQTHAGERRAAG